MKQQVICLDKKSLNSFQIKIKKQQFMSIDLLEKKIFFLLEKAGEMYVADHKNVFCAKYVDNNISFFCIKNWC